MSEGPGPRTLGCAVEAVLVNPFRTEKSNRLEEAPSVNVHP
jgi:hypothetical protein